MKLINKMYYLVLALAVVFTLNNCSTDEILPQNEEMNKTTNLDDFSKKKVSSASGQGGLTFDDGTFDGFQSFSFHVAMDVDGNVSGSWQSNYNDANDDFDINTHGTIECVTFVGNKMATMAGTITHANTGAYWDPFELEINDKAYFEVIDNGEGKHGTPDQFSDLFVGLNQLLCGDFNVVHHDIVNGNIQVKH